jgi:hypothetical protein
VTESNEEKKSKNEKNKKEEMTLCAKSEDEYCKCKGGKVFFGEKYKDQE